MSKHTFTYAEKYALWKHYNHICQWCKQPLRLIETTGDHFIPEHLDTKPNELAMVRADFNLPDTFLINDYCNWQPFHIRCNQEKGGGVPEPTPQMIAIAGRLIRDAERVRKIAQELKANVKKDTIIAKVMVAVETGAIALQELLDELAAAGLPQDEDVQELREEADYLLAGGFVLSKLSSELEAPIQRQVALKAVSPYVFDGVALVDNRCLAIEVSFLRHSSSLQLSLNHSLDRINASFLSMSIDHQSRFDLILALVLGEDARGSEQNMRELVTAAADRYKFRIVVKIYHYDELLKEFTFAARKKSKGKS